MYCVFVCVSFVFIFVFLCCLSYCLFFKFLCVCFFFFFFKQKTAYEMRISDWSSDVCSSDLVRLFGRGSHGSQPQTVIDPVSRAAATTMRLQTRVSREVAPSDSAVLTIGALQAGTKENIIPDEAMLKLNIRTYDENVRQHVLSAVRRICCAECAASNAPREPEFTSLSSYPLTRNDVESTEQVAQAFKKQFGEQAYETKPAAASEDFSIFGRTWKVPYVFWFVGRSEGHKSELQ